ncbi:MAG: 50S ribosomal protein L30 [Deltaproteobacteria bacterium]|nr:50S ribosomal protein L30 [Deltaproteobacteria bacterium]
MAGKIRIKQTKSQIGRPGKQHLVLKGMGLGRIGKVVELEDTPQIRGMALKVAHLVSVEEVVE